MRCSDVVPTQAQLRKQKGLFDKIKAGIRVKESEYPAWQRAPKSPSTWGGYEGASLGEYLKAMGRTDEQCHPASIDWREYYIREAKQ